ncbi:LytTR family DNA-binding domain-containing protein [Hymenobacter sp.]|uniref:LytR/AlgR family response regulator transcription factor n=1 Tax=Hymenobacter sp. TaxID=1898978 RepID=UPI00286BF9A3|nr:LytTR family DNA-binding domain-containing protein [Hymenobacter sp.]
MTTAALPAATAPALRCLVVDDEPLAIRVLERFIAAAPGLELAATARHAIEAFELLHRQKIDVLFLDINLPRLSGLDFVKALKNPPSVIFTTAHREFAADGFELDAVDYLVKPIAFERFARAVAKLPRPAPPAPAPEPAPATHLFVHLGRQLVKVPLDELLYAESRKDYVRLVTRARSLLVKQGLGALAEQLLPNRFCRIHRSFLVNLAHVEAHGRTAVTVGGTRLPLGRLYRAAALRQLAVACAPTA